MNRLLQFIAAHMGFLWAEGRYRIIDSIVATTNGGDAVLMVESAVLRIRFVCDRTQLMMDLQPAANDDTWWGADLVQRLLDGGGARSGLLDESYASWMACHLSDVEALFQPEVWTETRLRLSAVRQVRAREMWGPAAWDEGN